MLRPRRRGNAGLVVWEACRRATVSVRLLCRHERKRACSRPGKSVGSCRPRLYKGPSCPASRLGTAAEADSVLESRAIGQCGEDGYTALRILYGQVASLAPANLLRCQTPSRRLVHPA